MTIAVDHSQKLFHLEDLKGADLTGISLIPQPLALRLDFTFGTETYDTSIEFYHLLHQVISQPINADPYESCFWVGNIEITELKEERNQLLSTLIYPFQNQAGLVETGSSPLFYFQLEGDICIKIICGSYKIFQHVESIYPYPK